MSKEKKKNLHVASTEKLIEYEKLILFISILEIENVWSEILKLLHTVYRKF